MYCAEIMFKVFPKGVWPLTTDLVQMRRLTTFDHRMETWFSIILNSKFRYIH